MHGLSFRPILGSTRGVVCRMRCWGRHRHAHRHGRHRLQRLLARSVHAHFDGRVSSLSSGLDNRCARCRRRDLMHGLSFRPILGSTRGVVCRMRSWGRHRHAHRHGRHRLQRLLARSVQPKLAGRLWCVYCWAVHRRSRPRPLSSLSPGLHHKHALRRRRHGVYTMCCWAV
eukprot:COSAG05_NODE_132_length_17128_cov_54.447355_5_plen_171_part_00